MREDELVGYCLGALDDIEMKRVETALADPVQGPPLRRNIDSIRRAFGPLEADRGLLPPPPGLASRTLAFVSSQAAVPSAAVRPATRPPVQRSSDDAGWQGSSSRRWIDRAILAASAIAASVLVVPLLLESIAEARARRAQRNLQTLAGSLQGYGQSHRTLPTPPGDGPLSRAGLYAPTLVSEHRLVADDGTVLVPDSEHARRGGHRVPTLEELREAVGTPKFEELMQSMGGDFGYTLGHRDGSGALQPNRDRRRMHHPLMADAPDESGERSSNHPEGLHFILFEDGHVERVNGDALHRDDHLYRNESGEIRAAKNPDDAVIGDSHHQP